MQYVIGQCASVVLVYYDLEHLRLGIEGSVIFLFTDAERIEFNGKVHAVEISALEFGV